MEQDFENAALQEFDRFEDFVRIICGLYKQIQKIKSLEMQELGLKGPQVMCLFYLSRHGEGLTAAQLCQLIAIDKAAVSRVLAQLREQGLIAYPEAARRYRTRVVLTGSGREISRRICMLISDIVSRADEGVEEAARKTMYASLYRIAENLKEISLGSASGPADEYEETGAMI